MAALAADIQISTVGTPTKVALSANGADIFYKGSVVWIDASGGAQLATYASGDRPVGIASHQQTITAAAQLVEVYVEGYFWTPIATNVAAADEGELLAFDGGGTDNLVDCVAVGDITVATADSIFAKIIRVAASAMLIYIGPAITGAQVRTDTGTGDYAFV